MRAIGFFITAMLLCPLFQHHEMMDGRNRLAGKQNIPFNFKVPFNNFAPSFNQRKKKDTIDTSQLKQSDWYSNVVSNIRETEYEIKPAEDDHVFASPNRQQNIKAFYTADKFTLEPGEKDDWKLQLTLKGIYSGKKKIYSTQKKAVAVAEKNKIQFNHNNNFAVEYINNKEGIRQNFIIQKKPADQCSKIMVQLSTNKGWYINKVHDKELHFAKLQGNELSKKINYNNLKVWDATNKELAAKFVVNKNHSAFEIEVNAAEAIYPVTIDPLSTSPAMTITGSNAGDIFGFSVASAGDVNGDGYSDVIVGAKTFSTNKGAAYIFMGSSTGISASPATTLQGIVSGDYFGNSVSSAGDVNGDGYSDVVVGAFGVAPTNKGAVYIFQGSGTGISPFPATTLNGINPGDYFGISVACAGDVNGDGYSDVVVGADAVNSNTGAAYIFMGSNTGLSASPIITLNGSSTNDHFGNSVASAGDVNGDGYSDVIVGAWGVSSLKGAAYVFPGSSTGLSTSPSTILNDIDNIANDQFGYSVTCAGDVNGDGYSDVIVGAWGVSSLKGAAYIFPGSNTGVLASPTTTLNDIESIPNNQFGYSVSGAGDVNGDGYSDVIVGAYNASSNKGAAYLFQGSNTGLSSSPAVTLNGIAVNDQFGYSVASAGDINGDGYSDVVIGAYGASVNTGAAYTYHGSPDGFTASPARTFNGSITNDKVGFSVASAGDVNGDGYSDVVVGAFGIAVNTGAVYIYPGSSTGLSASAITTLFGSSPGSLFGYSVASAGDVNGDGYADVIIGAVGVSPKGAAYIFLGNSTGVLTSTPALNGINSGDNFGYSVAGAGDINGDGYSDVVVGASNVSSNAGAAYIFSGKSTGVLTLSTTLNGSSPGGRFGVSVASAGDVNGDGFSDVVVGAYTVPPAGAAYIFIGGSTGLSASPTTTLNGISAGDQFGVSVTGAGDINGDGFSDVVVGALGVSSSTGAAYTFLGNNTGILTSSTILNGSGAGAQFGISVASAGDVNGDGYSDVVVGANSASPAGTAYIFPGSSTGILPIPAATLIGSVGEGFGGTVASAGDINGDGYSDIIAGAPNRSSNAGAAYAYLGNSNSGIRNNLRLYNSDLTTPIQQSNMADPNLFGAGLYAKSFIGKQKGKLVWQTVRNGNPFSGSPITNSTLLTSQQVSLTDLGLTGFELKNQIAKLVPTKATYIRARVKYDKTTAITGQVYGPWRYPEGFMRGRRDVGSVALPVKFISFTAVKQNETVLLKWITTDETSGLNYEVQHSTNGINFTSIKTLPSQNNSRSEYEWLHTDPAKGKNYYRIRAVENGKNAFTETRQVVFQSAGAIKLYPNPVKSGTALTIESSGNLLPGITMIEISDMSGQRKKQYLFSSFNSTIAIPLPELPAGQYIVRLFNEKNVLYSSKFMVVK